MARISGLSLLLPCIAATLCFAQAGAKATVWGQVSDAKGARIGYAEVKLVECSTGTARTVLTGTRGTFRFESLEPGKYKVVVARPGFSVLELEPQQAATGSVLRVDAVLAPTPNATTVAMRTGRGE